MEEKFQRKLQILMKNEGISQSRLAEMLEVKPSTLSHILAGRNYPGFDMLQKLRRLFPHINADWLLLDTSEDYLATAPTAPTASAASNLFSDGNAPDNAATAMTWGALGNAPHSSAPAAGRFAGTVGGAGVVGDTRTARNMRTAASAAGTIGSTRTVGSVAGTVSGARTVGSVAGTTRGTRIVGSATGSVGNTGAGGAGAAAGAGVAAQGMAAPSLFDASSSSNASSTGTDAASSAVSAQMLSSLNLADGVRIRRIIVLYEDNSFESFTPRP